MVTSISEELYIFLATIYGGILIGFIYDLYRVFRGIFKPKIVATVVEDLIFWIIVGGVAFFVLFFTNDGQLRFYTFLGFLIGAVMYIWILSQFVIRIIIALIKTIKKVVNTVFKMIVFPFKRIISFLKGPCHWIIKKLKPIYGSIKRLKQLPKRYLGQMKKEVKLIIKKK